METGKIKKFATEARNVLKRGIEAKITTLGFDATGNVAEANKPQLVQGGCLWNGSIQTEDFYQQWLALYRRVQEKGIREVYEEAAYTWFNRLMAIRILQKNQLCEPVMEYVDEARTPRIVDEARMGRIPQMTDDDRARLTELLDDDTKTTEQFALLIAAFCHKNPIISASFGRMQDYTELLLPLNILAEGGFVDMINHTEFITNEEFRLPELIGWLYQFYISERKDEVFAKKGKVEADEIPAATQIFTPNWIVKYMVQNTVGRIYLDNNPYMAEKLKPKWRYLVDPAEPTPAEAVYRYSELEDLKVADLACGSGHILNECFDLLYDLYITEGYSRSEAIDNLFTHNLTGIDIDTRAKQLAMFSLLLKACQKDSSFADAHCLPRVMDMPKVDRYTWLETVGHMECNMPIGRHITEEENKEICDGFILMQNADSLGSIMKFNLSESTREYMQAYVEEFARAPKFEENFSPVIAAFRVMLALTENYSALVMNPPYMGSSKMNDVLSNYAKKNYPISKGDLFAIFIERSMRMLEMHGRAGLITMEAWMFLSSYEDLRKYIIDNYYISSLGHFGWHIIGIAFGTVMTIFEKSKAGDRRGEYSYLTIDDVDRTKNVPFIYPKKDNGRYAIVSQQNFEKIPGSPIGYWLSDSALHSFDNIQLKKLGEPRSGIMTGNSPKFVKFFFEVSLNKIGYNYDNESDIYTYKKKWFPIVAGGSARKWYGNLDSVVNLENGGKEIKETVTNYRLRDAKYYFKQSITWSKICSGITTFRLCPTGVLFGDSGLNLFLDKDLDIIMGLMNSKAVLYLLKVINPTFNNQVSDIGNIPIPATLPQSEALVSQNISISKQDWDAHETSWDFETNELIKAKSICGGNVADMDMLDEDEIKEIEAIKHIPTNAKLISDCVLAYKNKWERNFMQLHQNEEELNRQFIEIYGLQDELTPDVPLSEITILQQGEISIENDEEPIH